MTYTPWIDCMDGFKYSQEDDAAILDTDRAQRIIDAAHRVSDGGVPLGKLIREGHQDPMSARVRYEYAAVIRAAVQCVLPDEIGGVQTAWKQEMLNIAD